MGLRFFTAYLSTSSLANASVLVSAHIHSKLSVLTFRQVGRTGSGKVTCLLSLSFWRGLTLYRAL